MRTPLRVVALSILFLPAAAWAQSARFEITPLAGYRASGQVTAYDDFEDELIDTDLEVEESEFYGVVADIPLSRNWKLELLANRQESNFILDEGIFEPVENLGDVTIDYYHVGLLYEWGRGQVNPFVTAAVGLARIEPSSRLVDAEDRASASLGGGVKIFFSRNIGLRLEGRGYWTDLDTGISDGSGRRRRQVEEALYQGEASAGLILAF
jgi:hypothetical protein